MNLSTEDSIRPVSCNGPGKPLASHPFLSPPYAGWNSMVSYFDHDSPNFLRDGLVIAVTGLQAHPDAAHHAWDFPAYWSTALRQYLYYDGHNGYDYGLWYQPVYAAAPGRVIFAGPEYPDAVGHGYGKMVMIDHHNGYVTLYGHFSKLRVKAGQRVKRLQELGISGNTGHSSGPHLHFSVFHNCSPTDPYGWTGSGPDPLASYQNETSVYLWLAPPLVVNPLPHMPGLEEMPPTSMSRLLLLRLPSARGGTHAFISELRREARAVQVAFGRTRGLRVDLLHGAVEVRARVSTSRLYALPFVASVASRDAAGDARADLLAALGRAALVDRRKGLPLGRSRAWTGYLFEWQGRTFLLGQGPKARKANLRLTGASGGARVHKVQADPVTGTYAVDLGRLSRTAIASLARQLRSAGRKSTISEQPQRGAALRPVKRRGETGVNDAALASLLVLVALAISGAGGATVWYARRRRQD